MEPGDPTRKSPGPRAGGTSIQGGVTVQTILDDWRRTGKEPSIVDVIHSLNDMTEGLAQLQKTSQDASIERQQIMKQNHGIMHLLEKLSEQLGYSKSAFDASNSPSESTPATGLQKAWRQIYRRNLEKEEQSWMGIQEAVHLQDESLSSRCGNLVNVEAPQTAQLPRALSDMALNSSLTSGLEAAIKPSRPKRALSDSALIMMSSRRKVFLEAAVIPTEAEPLLNAQSVSKNTGEDESSCSLHCQPPQHQTEEQDENRMRQSMTRNETGAKELPAYQCSPQ